MLIYEYGFSIDDSKQSNKLFFVSGIKKPILTLEPRIPDNFLTRNNFEDNTTKRVCLSTSISGCLTALSCNLTNKILYVYTPMDDMEVYTPDVDEVPDVNITDEKWCLNTCVVRLCYKILVIDATDDEYPYTYGGKHLACLYGWRYKILNTYYPVS